MTTHLQVKNRQAVVSKGEQDLDIVPSIVLKTWQTIIIYFGTEIPVVYF